MDRRFYLIDVEGVLVRDKSYRPVAGSVAWLGGLAARGIASLRYDKRTFVLDQGNFYDPASGARLLTADGLDARFFVDADNANILLTIMPGSQVQSA